MASLSRYPLFGRRDISKPISFSHQLTPVAKGPAAASAARKGQENVTIIMKCCTNYSLPHSCLR